MNGTVSLSKYRGGGSAPAFMSGQAYSVSVAMEMPESPANRDSGMFMVCMRMRSRDGAAKQEDCKATMLRYRSELLRIIETITFAPLLMSGQ